MNITIINDCRDTNAASRQLARAQSLFNAPATFIGVSTDLEAAGSLIDTLDAYEDRPAIILANVAPRHGHGKKWPNGTPFGYFKYRDNLIASTIDGFVLSLAKKFGLTDSIQVFSYPDTVDTLVENNLLSQARVDYLINTQFRSYEFLPKAAYLVSQGIEVPTQDLSISDIADAPKNIWWIDNFGNCKTTLVASDVDFDQLTSLQTRVGNLPVHPKLKDVPNGELAVVAGSSGLGSQRFLEIVLQGQSAAAKLGLQVGDPII